MEEKTLIQALSDEEKDAYQRVLLTLLARRTRLYTMDESSSVRVEVALELLDGVRFLLELQMGVTGTGVRELLRTDAEAFLGQAIETALAQTRAGKKLYEAVCLRLPELKNDFMTSTLKEIGGFFKHYDVRYFSHQIPASIAYPLCVAVPETMGGITFITQYLQRLALENHVLRQYPTAAAQRLLAVSYPDSKALPVNLYEPVLARELGNILLKNGVEALRALSPEELEASLRRAGIWLAETLNLELASAREYLVETAVSLRPRLWQSLQQGHPNGAFFTP